MLTQVSRILVPLDGSKNSFRGLETAVGLAKQCGAAITGVYAVDAPPSSEFSGIGSARAAHSDLVDKFMGKAAALAGKHGVAFRKKIVNGNPGYGIVRAAQGKNAFDLIVIGSRGRSSTKEIFFGSVSNYVVHTAKIPVMIVK